MEKCSPPWQVLDLVTHHLDPKTLATASAVCKSWYISMSSDHLWHPICSATYPSLSNLHPTTPTPYSKLYSLGRAADNRRLQPPPKPHLSMHDLIFAIDIHNNHKHIITVVKPGGELKLDRNGLFRFDIEVDSGGSFEAAVDSLRITWNVVLEGFKGVFTMMESKGKGSFVLGLKGWFSKELPSPGCCSGSAASGLVADLRLGLRESGGKVVVEKMSVGVLSIVSWRYVCVDDALRYLQHFLLVCNM
ncbi:hypothetical protein BUALT_Bualt16G0115900 [Buddleja alternifolia]|uniref:F-box protein n=1 Tax=Buddleja alternifolia TaxID=168488 RepID=A0AAV6WCQ7_9LAMI|nr:hypothetical protein BUALT_Bualt16G0115900 [Buddleja alternifolia]